MTSSIDGPRYTCPICGKALASALRPSVLAHEHSKQHRAALILWTRRWIAERRAR